MMPKRTWTQEDEFYLADRWGEFSYDSLAKKFNKSKNAIMLKAWKLGLPGIYNTGDFLNAYNIAKMLNVDIHTVTNYWISKCGLKANKRVLKNGERWAIKLENLLKWLKDNTDKWDSRKVELFALGAEPDWLKKKRKRDLKLPKRQKQKWTKREIRKLIFYYNQGMLQKDIGNLLGRSSNAVQCELVKLREKGIIYREREGKHGGA